MAAVVTTADSVEALSDSRQIELQRVSDGAGLFPDLPYVNAMNEEPSPRPGWRAVLLGLFVLFQAAYLPLANLIQQVPREVESRRGEFNIRIQREGAITDVRSVQDAINFFGSAIERYGEATGQVQAWSLFAPDFAKNSVFPAVDVFGAGKDGPYIVTMYPRAYPSDPGNYFRPPGFLSRLASYDYLLAVIYANYSEQSLRERPADWRAEVLQRVRNQQRSLLAYFRFSLKLFREQHPDDAEPQVMVLKVVVFPSPPPGSVDRPPPTTVRLARWFPNRPVEEGFLPVEAFDPVSGQFVRLPVEDEQ